MRNILLTSLLLTIISCGGGGSDGPDTTLNVDPNSTPTYNNPQGTNCYISLRTRRNLGAIDDPEAIERAKASEGVAIINCGPGSATNNQNQETTTSDTSDTTTSTDNDTTITPTPKPTAVATPTPEEVI